MDDRLDAHWWLTPPKLVKPTAKRGSGGVFISPPENHHGGKERLSGVQMLPQKTFYLKVLGGFGGVFQEAPKRTLVLQQIPIYRYVVNAKSHLNIPKASRTNVALLHRHGGGRWRRQI